MGIVPPGPMGVLVPAASSNPKEKRILLRFVVRVARAACLRFGPVFGGGAAGLGVWKEGNWHLDWAAETRVKSFGWGVRAKERRRDRAKRLSVIFGEAGEELLNVPGAWVGVEEVIFRSKSLPRYSTCPVAVVQF